jgi:type IV secretion system protein VirB8
MDKSGLKEYIDSRDYFKNARAWYNTKYLLPITHRVWISYAAMLLVLMFVALAINIEKLLPIKQKLTYAINITPSPKALGETNARIEDMRVLNKAIMPNRFIARSLLESYVTNRESFSYGNLESQFKYVENTSTRLVYRRFYNYMSVNNPESPLMRYQQYAKRSVTINEILFNSDNEAIVEFNSIAKDSSGSIFENLNWAATVNFDMGKVGERLPNGSPFKFTVVDYSLKLLGEAI